MPENYRHILKCDFCPAIVDRPGYEPIHKVPQFRGWIVLQGDALSRSLCLCPKCGQDLLDRAGIGRMPADLERAAAKERLAADVG